MRKLTSKEIDEKIKSFIKEDGSEEDFINLQEDLNKSVYKKAVLGIDIYRYSQYRKLPQILIPHLFKDIYDLTVQNCLDNEPCIFFDLKSADFRQKFIDTGDGGFQILDNPFQAVIFAIYFQANVARYNSNYILTKKLNDIIGDITLRYTLTFDDVYSYESNYFGAGIINCARIIAKDKLNRFLIDENTRSWFIREINCVENLPYLELKEDYKHFNFLDRDGGEKFKSIVFAEDMLKIKNVDLMKIGEIKSKLDTISIYNLHVKTLMISDGTGYKPIAITLGNLNSNGLDI